MKLYEVYRDLEKFVSKGELSYTISKNKETVKYRLLNTIITLSEGKVKFEASGKIYKEIFFHDNKENEEFYADVIAEEVIHMI